MVQYLVNAKTKLNSNIVNSLNYHIRSKNMSSLMFVRGKRSIQVYNNCDDFLVSPTSAIRLLSSSWTRRDIISSEAAAIWLQQPRNKARTKPTTLMAVFIPFVYKSFLSCGSCLFTFIGVTIDFSDRET